MGADSISSTFFFDLGSSWKTCHNYCLHVDVWKAAEMEEIRHEHREGYWFWHWELCNKSLEERLFEFSTLPAIKLQANQTRKEEVDNEPLSFTPQYCSGPLQDFEGSAKQSTDKSAQMHIARQSKARKEKQEQVDRYELILSYLYNFHSSLYVFFPMKSIMDREDKAIFF